MHFTFPGPLAVIGGQGREGRERKVSEIGRGRNGRKRKDVKGY